MPSASLYWSKPGKVQVKRNLSRWNKAVCHDKSSLRRVGGFAAKIPQTLFVKNLDANEPLFCPCPAANLFWCKRADNSKIVIAYNGPVVGLVAICVRAGMSFCKVPIDGRDVYRPDETVKIAKSR